MGPEKRIVPIRLLISRDEVAFVNAGAAGIFMAQAQHGSSVKKGQLLGIIATR